MSFLRLVCCHKTHSGNRYRAVKATGDERVSKDLKTRVNNNPIVGQSDNEFRDKAFAQPHGLSGCEPSTKRYFRRFRTRVQIT